MTSNTISGILPLLYILNSEASIMRTELDSSEFAGNIDILSDTLVI